MSLLRRGPARAFRLGCWEGEEGGGRTQRRGGREGGRERERRRGREREREENAERGTAHGRCTDGARTAGTPGSERLAVGERVLLGHGGGLWLARSAGRLDLTFQPAKHSF